MARNDTRETEEQMVAGFETFYSRWSGDTQDLDVEWSCLSSTLKVEAKLAWSGAKKHLEVQGHNSLSNVENFESKL